MHKDKPVILFVDDESAVLNALSRQLRHQKGKWRLEFESSPRAALDTARNLDIDVVVSDMQMPGMNGLELISAFRLISPKSAFIMLTGNSDLTTAVDAINEAGVVRYYTKPCSTEELQKGIEAVLDARHTIESTSGTQDQTLSNITKDLGLAALDHLSLSVIVVDAEGRIVLTNKSGGALLSRGDGLNRSAGEICKASNPSESEKLHQLIRTAASGAAESEQGSYVISVERPSCKRAYSILAIPIGASPTEQNETLVALYVADPANQPLPSSEAISRLFSLTPAEARIVHELVKGASLDEAAQNAGVTVGTARTYLKQVFSKTDTKRQAELVKLVLTYPRLWTAESAQSG